MSRDSTYELHKAADAGSAKRILALLSKSGAKIDQPDTSSLTPLVLAAAKGHAHVVDILLQRGANTSLPSDDGVTPLLISAQNGHLEVVNLLLKAGANLEAVTRSLSSTSLHLAAQRGHPEVVRALIEAGANVNCRRSDGATPLLSAATKGHAHVMRELLHAEADPLLPMVWEDSPGHSYSYLPLDVGAQYGHPSAVRELIEHHGIKGCGGASGGVDALSQAAQYQDMESMALLVGAGVVDTGSALHAAATNCREGPVKLLLQHQQQRGKSTREIAHYVNQRDNLGQTPLICSILFSARADLDQAMPFPRIVRLLVDAGAHTASRVRLWDRKGGGFDGTPLALTTKILQDKKVSRSRATEEDVNRLEAIRRLLLRVEAVRAISWLWPGGVPHDSHASNRTAMKTSTSTSMKETPVAAMVPALRRRPLRRGGLLAGVFR